MSLNPPRSYGAALTKIFFGVGLTLPVITALLAIAYAQVGLIGQVEVYPWDQILSVLFLLAIFVTPESICVYLFQTKRINRFLTRMSFIVIVVFLYGNYIFLIPSNAYFVLPEAAAWLLWAVWPPLATLAVGFVVGRIESKRLFIESMYSAKES